MKLNQLMLIVVTICTIFLGACSTPYKELNSDLREYKDEPYFTYSFAFKVKDSSYLFFRKNFKQDGLNCYLYLGFKDEKLKYVFPDSAFYKINKVYNENDSPEAIKKLILQNIDKENIDPNKCIENGYSKSKYAGNFGQGLGIAVMLFPITITFALWEVRNQILHKWITQSMPLGIPFSKVPEDVKKYWVKKKRGRYEYYEFKRYDLGVIFYFKDHKLDAWSQFHTD